MNVETEFPIKNNSPTAVIPPFSVVRAVGFDSATGSVVVDAPNIDNQEGLIVTGEGTILGGGFGKGSLSNKCIVSYDTADTPVFGDTFGSVAGQYKLKRGKFGFRTFLGQFLGIMNAVRSGLSVADVGTLILPPAVVGSCGWLSELINWSAIKMEIDSAGGMCGCIDLDQVLMLVKNGTLGEWEPITGSEYPTRLVACTDEFDVKFINIGCGPPCLELTSTPASGGGVTTRLFFDYCDNIHKALYFRGSGDVFCDGTPTPCVGDDTFRVKLSCGVICQCDTTYPVPARLHVTFVGGDFTDCISDGQTYAVDYNGSIAPGGEQWEYKSASGTGCGPFTGYVPFFPHGVTVTAVGCLDGPYAVGIFLQGDWNGTNAPAVEFRSVVDGNRNIQCNPLVIEFDELETNFLGSGAAALFASIGSVVPTKILVTA